jgi:hypothetical protein
MSFGPVKSGGLGYERSFLTDLWPVHAGALYFACITSSLVERKDSGKSRAKYISPP